MTLAEVVFLVVFVCWLPLGALVVVMLGKAAKHGDRQPERPLEMCEPRVRDQRVRRHREGCVR